MIEYKPILNILLQGFVPVAANISKMKYEQLAIPRSLKDCVKTIWKLEDDRTDNVIKSFRIVADGCPGMIFQHTDQGRFYQDNKALPVAFLYGSSSRYSSIQFAGQFNSIGVFFRPQALKTVFGLNASELTDDCADVDALAGLHNFRLSEKLLNTDSSERKLEALTGFLCTLRMQNEKLTNHDVQYALTKMIVSEGKLPLQSIVQNLHISERTFQRKFMEQVGISPKLFSRICQFQSTLKQIRKKDLFKLSDVAFDNLYADQSHFIRAFKEFAGYVPHQYIRQAREVVDNLNEVGV